MSIDALVDAWDNRDKEADLVERRAKDGVKIDVIEIRPGERCPTCNRRKNKPRQTTTPEARKVNAGLLPPDRAEALEEWIDTLQEFVGADPHSYPRGAVVEAAVLLAIQQREELKEHFHGA